MNKLNFEPLDDKVVIKPQDPETMSSGGIYIPEGAQKEAVSGTVVAVGPGSHKFGSDERYKMKCKVGDIVYYPKFGAHSFEFEGEDYIVIKEGDLFVRMEVKEPILDKDALKEALSETKPLSDDE